MKIEKITDTELEMELIKQAREIGITIKRSVNIYSFKNGYVIERGGVLVFLKREVSLFEPPDKEKIRHAIYEYEVDSNF